MKSGKPRAPASENLELLLHLPYVAITDDAERAAVSFLENMGRVVGRYGGD